MCHLISPFFGGGGGEGMFKDSDVVQSCFIDIFPSSMSFIM
jgi:hypothetical protein